MSSGALKYLVGLADDRVDFASDITFKAANDFDLAHSLRGSRRRRYASAGRSKA